MKLKKLILSGFKSFADRTEFEFDDGISCVVGPNGCGKSNVVDAIKWVLGEQSAKSLRGSEMMDVIFNGSSARKAAGMAEVTLVFDNRSGQLQLTGRDADTEKATCHEVSVSRRLYRNGQSEYLINRAPARLKDIKEMFMDTGVGADAYSVIEQGRISEFIQASGDDRRAIFDEAAGISKYKARRKEAIRKLDRVEQNLLRVQDVFQEVEKRLRSIKVQAGRARNYQSYSERLKELRSLHFLSQYHRQRARRVALKDKLDAGHDRLSGVTARIDQLEAARSATEVEAVDLERTARQLQSQVASIGGQITTAQQRADMLESRVKELVEQIISAAQRADQLEAKLADHETQLAARQAEIGQQDQRIEQLESEQAGLRDQHDQAERRVGELAARLDEEKSASLDLLDRMGALRNEMHGLEVRAESLTGQRERLQQRGQEIDDALAEATSQKAQADQQLQVVRGEMETAQQQLEAARDQARQLADDEQQLRNQLSEARENRSASASRAKALREMQQRLEGVGAGVRRVLQARREGKLPFVRGMLGELIRTDTDHAVLVEAALAGMDQCLVADTLDQLNDARAQLYEVLGKNASADMLCIDRFGQDTHSPAMVPGMDGCLSDWVTCEPALEPIVRSLLGRTFAVADLPAAMAVSANAPAGARFVTSDGDVLEADGRVRLAAARSGAGVVARQSELAALEAQLKRLDEQIESLQGRCQSTHEQREQLETRQQELRSAVYDANARRVECQSRIGKIDEEIARLQREKPVVASDLAALSEALQRAESRREQAGAELAQATSDNASREQAMARLEQTISAARAEQSEVNARVTELKVALAEAQQKKLSLCDSLAQLKLQGEQMADDLAAARQTISSGRKRKEEAEQTITASREEVEQLYEKQQALSIEATEAEESREGLTEKLQQIRSQLGEQRKASESAGEDLNRLKVELGEVDVRIENLIARASDEMSMDLVDAYANYEHDEDRDWQGVETEIAELREKIRRLGNVNLDAISEQEELEKRREFLGAQIEDVETSHRQLDELIKRINRESRELFAKTFEQIRDNFRDLFRKLFGGGKADILLTDPEDLLESPIEIVARPPGKETRNLSLLSGGEKAMTALALLFGIFRSKPSPFCLLDEVDAPLDEANTERFAHIVKEFVDQSQFIIITHAKRSMSMANVLYGVTMGEPGVSRRISVRFEEAKRLAEDEQLQSA